MVKATNKPLAPVGKKIGYGGGKRLAWLKTCRATYHTKVCWASSKIKRSARPAMLICGRISTCRQNLVEITE